MLNGLKSKLNSGNSMAPDSPGMNFLPDGYAERRRRRRTDAVCLVMFIAVVGIVGLTFSVGEKRIAAAEAESRQVDEQYAEAARRIEQVKQMRDKQKTVADRMELTASLLEKLPRSNILAEVTNALPPGVSLTDAALEAKRRVATAPVAQTKFDKKAAAAAPPASPQPLSYDTTIVVTGVAYTEGQVSDYIDTLGKSSYFQSVDLKWVRKGSNIDKKDESMRTFMISLSIDPAAEARKEVRRKPRLQTSAPESPLLNPAATAEVSGGDVTEQ